MAYVLSKDGRDDDFPAAWRRYEGFIASVRDKLPSGALALANSNWYYNFNDHRCPHDSWVERFIIEEPSSGERSEVRTLALSVRLLGAYHDGFIELRYPRVYEYQLSVHNGTDGHRDWRYDEFRLSQQGNLIHEIEWSRNNDTGTWLIEASDIEFQWISK